MEPHRHPHSHAGPVPPGGTLLGVWAHPDDEAYLAAGLMARTAAAGGRVITVYATRGDRGTDDPVANPPERLARIRTREAMRAHTVLGARPPVFLDHRDGECDRVDPVAATRDLVAIMEAVRPDAVVTFGRDGITGHADHRAVSSWAVEAWQTVRRRRLLAPRMLLAAMEADFVARHAEWHERIDLFGPGGPAVTPVEDLRTRLELTEVELDLKRAALAAHASQTSELSRMMGESAYRTWWAVESFRDPTAAELSASGGTASGGTASGGTASGSTVPATAAA